MRSLIAFTKKEFTDQVRSGKVLFLGILFSLFGIMNPAIAKLTPWLMEQMADSLAESGMIVTSVTITALDSWMQFFKNVPMALIAFVLLESSIFTKEFRSGTLILSLTKGLNRYKAVLSKTFTLMMMWTASYWLYFGITYAYTVYYWDNSVVRHLMPSVVFWWVFGLWVISLVVWFSTLRSTNTGVLVGTGGIVLASYLCSMIPKAAKYLPTFLTDGNSLIYGLKEPDEYIAALIVTAAMTLVLLAVSFTIFNKKQL
ncbi:MAG: ABC transporter permease subunit [Clostridia bacterium]|nr:ABC transporter permease subunit [Clostridia bacterium]